MGPLMATTRSMVVCASNNIQYVTRSKSWIFKTIYYNHYNACNKMVIFNVIQLREEKKVVIENILC